MAQQETTLEERVDALIEYWEATHAMMMGIKDEESMTSWTLRQMTNELKACKEGKTFDTEGLDKFNDLTKSLKALFS